jgi:hypothetical protein
VPNSGSLFQAEEIDGKVEKIGVACLDDGKFGQMGFQQRQNHQIGAVGWPQSEISSVGGGVVYDWLRIGGHLGNVG